MLLPHIKPGKTKYDPKKIYGGKQYSNPPY